MKAKPLHIGNDAQGRPHFLTPKERTMGLHAIGTVGTGKSGLLNYCTEQDERDLPGALLWLDPHGGDPNSCYQQALCRSIRYRTRRPTYFVDLSHPKHVYCFAIFAPRAGADPGTRVQRFTRRMLAGWREFEPFERPRLLYWSTGLFATGLHHGDLGLSELRLLLDPERAALREHLTTGTPVESRWRALNQKRPAEFEEQTESVRNRIDQLTSAAGPRRAFGLMHQPAMIDFAEIIRQRARVYINVEESDELDFEHANIIMALITADFLDQACQRPNPERAPVALYIDEAHRVVNPDLARAFVEARKRFCFVTIAHQYLSQLKQEQDERVHDAVLSCARTKAVFALGSDKDAKELVHEIFVGPHGIDYLEPKFLHANTKHRPIAVREQSVSRSQGGGTTATEGESHDEAHSQSRTRGRSHTRTDGQNEAEGESDGTTHTKGTSHAKTHTEGEGRTWTKAHGVAHGRSRTKSHAEGHVHTETEQHATAATYGTISSHADSVTTPGDPALLATQTTTDTRGTTAQHSETHSRGISDTTSETDTESEGESVTHSRVRSRAYGRNLSDAESEAQNQSDGTSRTTTRTRGQSTSDADTDNTALTEAASKSRGRNSSHGKNKTWGTTVTDAPGTRHEEFNEPTVEFYPLAEHEQRKADALRLSPQRSYVLRRDDCSNAALTVPVRRFYRSSGRVQTLHLARKAAQTGAVSCEDADRIMTTRLQKVTSAAEAAAAAHADAGNDYVEPQRPKRKQPTKKEAPK